MPNRLAAPRWLRPSTWQASRTRRYRSTVYILPPSISKKIEGYRWQSFTPPAAALQARLKPRRRVSRRTGKNWLCRRRSVDTLVPEQCPGDTGCLIGHGDQHHVCRPPRQEPVGPARPRARLGAAPAQHGSRTMHEQAPDIAIPALRYPSQSILAATRVLSG